MVSLNLSLTENQALNQDGVTLLRSLSLVQGNTYAINLSLYSGYSLVNPTLSGFNFTLSDNRNTLLVWQTAFTPSGSGYNFTLPLTSPAIGSSQSYSGAFVFSGNGSLFTIEPFNVGIAQEADPINSADFVSSLNDLSSDISLVGAGSVSVSQSGQTVTISGEAPTGTFYPLNSNPSNYLTYSTIPADVVRTSGTQEISGLKNFDNLQIQTANIDYVNSGIVTINGVPCYRNQFYTVASQSGRYASSCVNGDVFDQSDIGHYFLVVNDTKLGTQDGYFDLGIYLKEPILLSGLSLNTYAPVQNSLVYVSSTGVWENSPTLSYQWQTGVSLSGAWANLGNSTTGFNPESCSYVGKYLRIQYVASNPYGTGTGYLTCTGAISSGAPLMISPPTIGGNYAGFNGNGWTIGTFSYCTTSGVVSHSTYQTALTPTGVWASGEYAYLYNPANGPYVWGCDELGRYIRIQTYVTNQFGSVTGNSNVVQITDPPNFTFGGTVIYDPTATTGTLPTWNLAINAGAGGIVQGDYVQFTRGDGSQIYFWFWQDSDYYGDDTGDPNPGGVGVEIVYDYSWSASDLFNGFSGALVDNGFAIGGSAGTFYVKDLNGGVNGADFTTSNPSAFEDIEPSFQNETLVSHTGDHIYLQIPPMPDMKCTVPPIGYQWYLATGTMGDPGNPISGATGTGIYCFTYGTGDYTLKASMSNAFGTATSYSNTITVVR